MESPMFVLTSLMPIEVLVQNLKEVCEDYLIDPSEEKLNRVNAYSVSVLIKEQVGNDVNKAMKLSHSTSQLSSMAESLGIVKGSKS